MWCKDVVGTWKDLVQWHCEGLAPHTRVLKGVEKETIGNINKRNRLSWVKAMADYTFMYSVTITCSIFLNLG